MNLKASKITVPFASLWDQIESNSGFNSVNSYHAARGSYNPYTLLIHARPLDAPADSQGRVEIDDYLNYLRNKIKSVTTEDARLHILLRETTWHHEIRHFHDCMCTPMGMHNFTIFEAYVRLIIVGLAELRKSGNTLTVPLKFLTSGDGADETTLRIANTYSNLLLHQILFNGDWSQSRSGVQLTRSEIIWVRFRNAPLELPPLLAFPATAQMDGEDNFTSVTPIGFRALTEAAARMIQNSIIRGFGQELVNRYSFLLRTNPEYGTVNRCVARIVKSKSSVNARVDEDELYRLVQVTLNTFGDHKPRGFSMMPGARFAEVVDQEIRAATSEDWESRRVSAVADIQATSAQHRARRSNGGHFVDKISRFAWSCFDQSGHVYNDLALNSRWSFDSLDWYLGIGCVSLPQPPISIYEEGVGFSALVSQQTMDELVSALVPWLFFINALGSMWASEIIQCPVIYGDEKPLYADPRFRPDPNCEVATVGGPCGSVSLGGSLAKHCNCLWKKCMIEWAVARED